MDTQALDNALSQLRKAGATDLPSKSMVLTAPDGTMWESKKSRSYDTWTLIKNNPASYNIVC